MAQFNKGILGGFSGKVGTVVGAKWRGKFIMRSLPSKSGKPATEAQIKQRTKFSMIAKFLAPVRKITARFYGEYQGSRSRTDLAMSYQMTDAIVEKPNGEFEINFKKVVLSKGYVPTVPLEKIELVDGNVSVTWSDNSDKNNAKENDRVLVILFSKSNQEFFVTPETDIFRKDKKAEIKIPSHWKPQDNVAWLLLSNELKNQGSNSMYVGEV